MLRRTILLLTLLAVACLSFAKDKKAETPPPQPASITRPQLEKRLGGLKQAHQQAVADVQALGGAIQDCEYWLSELDTAEKEAAKSDGKDKSKKEKKNGD